jgi:hypothetical protein
MVVSCAIATGASTSMSTRAAVARNNALFIQSSFFYSVFQTACAPPPLREGTHSVQNQNAKVSIILTIFNTFTAKNH